MRTYSPGGLLIAFAAAPKDLGPPTPSNHRLRRGLPGYLILFAPHAFEPQRQLQTREPLSPPVFRRKGHITVRSPGCQDLVRFFALLRIKPHAPPLVRVPVNSFEFHSCERTPQVEYLMRLRRHRASYETQHLVFIVYGVDYQGI